MEIFIVIFGTLIIPFAILICLAIIGRKYSNEISRKEKLVNTMENIIEMKSKIIRQIKALRILH
jgi:hypothetical protein